MLPTWDILMSVVMPAAPIPPPFERLEGRRFAFYPPILKIGSNEWTYRGATWSDILIRNTSAQRDLSIPRRFLGECSEIDHPVVIVGLMEELEFRDGAVRPHRCRVIEMPIAAGQAVKPRPEGQPLAPVVGIYLASRSESRIGRLAGGAVALGVLGCLAIAGYSLQGGEARRRAMVTSLDHTYLLLTSADTYPTVVQALGIPDSERRITTPEGKSLRVLDYADRGFRAVLMTELDGERYIGSVDEQGRVLQAVLLRRGVTSSPVLHALEDL